MGATEPERTEADKAQIALADEILKVTGRDAPVANGRSRSAFLAGCFRIIDFSESDPPCGVDDLIVFGRNEHWGTTSPRKNWDPPPLRLCAFTFPRSGGGRDRYDFWVVVRSVAVAAGEIP